MSYRIHDVPVDGGTLRVGDWGPADPDRPVATTVIAVHGITASHLSWALVARSMPAGVRLVAPDLRGRGRSAGLPGPYGMARHAADLEAVVEALELPPAVLVGHSMGGFVALVAAHASPDRFTDIVLVDGGLPLTVPAGISRENLFEAMLGPAARRLSMTFPDHASYLDFWRQHPAFAADPGGAEDRDAERTLADYARYDLTGVEPELRPSASLEAVREDLIDLLGGGVLMTALGELTRPVSLITAPRGMLDETPGLYSPSEVERWRAQLPSLTITEVPDVNHYTIVMGTAGATATAKEILKSPHLTPTDLGSLSTSPPRI